MDQQPEFVKRGDTARHVDPACNWLFKVNGLAGQK
jgi:hypothetical protein